MWGLAFFQKRKFLQLPPSIFSAKRSFFFSLQPVFGVGIDAKLDTIMNDVTRIKRKMREAEVEMADVWSESKRSKSEHAPFKDSLIATYQRAGPLHSSGAPQVLCMVLNKPSSNPRSSPRTSGNTPRRKGYQSSDLTKPMLTTPETVCFSQ